MILILLKVLMVVVCFLLVLVVLLQSGKGADLAGAFGGGSTQTAFGSRGPASFLTRVTWVLAIIFMLNALGLSMMNDRRSTENRSILETSGKPTDQGQEPKADTGAAPTSIPTPAQIEEEIRQIQERQQDIPMDDDGFLPSE